MSQGFSPHSGGSFGTPPGGFSRPSTPPVTGTPPGGFPSAPESGGGGFRTGSAPALLLLPSLLCGIIGLILNFVLLLGSAETTDTSFAVTAVIGWALAVFVGIPLLGLYFREDNRRRGAGLYIEMDWKRALYWFTIVALIAAVIFSAVHFALWVGKL